MTYKEKTDRIQLMKKLDEQQKEINKEYEEKGLTDELLEKQIQINTTRHKENMPDTTKNIYKNFVQ